MLTRQLRLTAGAHKTLLMPRLVPISHATFGQGLKMRRVKGHVEILMTHFENLHNPAGPGLIMSPMGLHGFF